MDSCASGFPVLIVKLEKIDYHNHIHNTQNLKAKAVPNNGCPATPSVNGYCQEADNEIPGRKHIKQEKASEGSLNIRKSTKLGPPSPGTDIQNPSISNEEHHNIKEMKVSSTVLIEQERTSIRTASNRVTPKVNQINDNASKSSNKTGNSNHFDPRTDKTSALKSSLKSILKDILILSKDYENIETNSLDEEIEKLRAKNYLPPLKHTLKTVKPRAMADDSDFGEGSEGDTGSACNPRSSETSEQYNELDNSSRGSGSLESEKRTKKVNEDDADSDKLVIDEGRIESEDEPEFVDIIDIEKFCKNNENVEAVIFNGVLVKIDPQEPECPGCARTFKTVTALKTHFRFCSVERIDISENDLRPNHIKQETTLPEKRGTTLSEKREATLSERQETALLERHKTTLSEMRETTLPERQETALPERQETTLSEKWETTLSGRQETALSEMQETTLSEKQETTLSENSTLNIKIVEVFSAGEKMERCFVNSCKFTGTTAELQRHVSNVHYRKVTRSNISSSDSGDCNKQVSQRRNKRQWIFNQRRCSVSLMKKKR